MANINDVTPTVHGCLVSIDWEVDELQEWMERQGIEDQMPMGVHDTLNRIRECVGLAYGYMAKGEIEPDRCTILVTKHG